MQPHAPYIAGHLESSNPIEPPWDEPVRQLRAGEVDRDAVWEQYLDNLRIVLDEVERLLENVDAEQVVITADHGEASGEMGLYEHPIGCLHPVVKKVPWVGTTAVDRRTSFRASTTAQASKPTRRPSSRPWATCSQWAAPVDRPCVDAGSRYAPCTQRYHRLPVTVRVTSPRSRSGRVRQGHLGVLYRPRNRPSTPPEPPVPPAPPAGLPPPPALTGNCR